MTVIEIPDRVGIAVATILVQPPPHSLREEKKIEETDRTEQ
jgi:hypothetical protein